MKRFLASLFSLVLFLSISSFVFAEHSAPHRSESGDVPERNGVYPDPRDRSVRVRVFIHDPKARVALQVSNICGDPESSATVSATGWHLPSNVTYRLNASSVPSSVGSSNIASISANAFSVWQNEVPGKVSFAKGRDTSVSRSSYDGQNIVAWGRTSSSALAVTYIRYYLSNGLVVDVDTIFNKRYAWAWTDTLLNGNCSIYPNAYDAQNILTHELGHWMGLDDHYDTSYVDNTMYGYGSKGETKKNTLTNGDKVNLSTIY